MEMGTEGGKRINEIFRKEQLVRLIIVFGHNSVANSLEQFRSV